MPNRVIKPTSRLRSILLADCLSSLLVLELLKPSPIYYVFSAWMSDFPLIGNRFGQFRVLLPELVGSEVRLAKVLNALHNVGSEVYILTRTDPSNSEFLTKLNLGIYKKHGASVHDKTFVCERFYLRGGMNFTFTGVNASDDTVELTTDPEEVSKALLEAQHRWETIR